MSHVTFKNIKGTENISAHHILCLRCIALYNSLNTKREEKEFGHNIFEELSPISADPLTQTEQNENKYTQKTALTFKTRLTKEKKVTRNRPAIL